jgi:toxin ParE1/3/4
MTYLVRLTSRAQRDFSDLFQEIRAERVQAAFDWYVGLRDAILSIEEHPSRCPVIRRTGKIRHLPYGRKPHVY